MYQTVNFNTQQIFMTIKIENKNFCRMLPPKFQPITPA